MLPCTRHATTDHRILKYLKEHPTHLQRVNADWEISESDIKSTTSDTPVGSNSLLRRKARNNQLFHDPVLKWISGNASWEFWITMVENSTKGVKLYRNGSNDIAL